MRFKAASLSGEASISRWRACTYFNTFGTETSREEMRTCVQVSLLSLVRAPNGTPLCLSARRMTSAMELRMSLAIVSSIQK